MPPWASAGVAGTISKAPTTAEPSTAATYAPLRRSRTRSLLQGRGVKGYLGALPARDSIRDIRLSIAALFRPGASGTADPRRRHHDVVEPERVIAVAVALP